jgi:hypothetical protein
VMALSRPLGTCDLAMTGVVQGRGPWVSGQNRPI